MAVEVLLVPGAGAEGTKTSSLVLLKKYFEKVIGISSGFVDGVISDSNKQRATTPSEQADQISKLVKPNTVIVSQSLGALGVIESLRDPVIRAATAGVVLIAPPARRPYSDVFLHPALVERLDAKPSKSGLFGGDVNIRTYSHPEGLSLTEAYQQEIAEHNDSFDDELRELTGLGIAKVVRPSRDWNQNYDTQTYPGTVEVIGTHSLAGGGPEELLMATKTVFGHIVMATNALDVVQSRTT